MSRDADAFSEIVRRHSSMVYATCLRILRNPADAEEAAQECFIKLATGDIELRSSLGGWLHRVATRHALDRIKIERRRQRRDAAYAATTPEAEEPTWEEISEHVDEVIADLPEKYRFAVVSHFLEGQSYDAISQTLGIPRSTVAYRVYKGVELARRGLSRRGITTATATLATLLVTHAAEAAAPETLTASLGKLAVSGLRRGAPVRPISKPGGLSWLAAGVMALVLFLAFRGAPLWRAEEPEVPVGQGSATTATLPAAVAPDSPVVEVRDRGVAAPESLSAPADPVAAVADAPEMEPETPSLAKISGRVTDNEGNPLSGATVYARTNRDALGYGIIQACETQTGPDGRYSIEVLPGNLMIYAHAPGYLMMQNFDRTVEAGRTYTGLDFGLTPSRVQMTGRVVDESGRGLAGATVHLRACGMLEGETTGYMSDLLNLAFANTDATGAFALDVEIEGLADLTVECEGYASGHFPSIEAPCQDLQLTLGRGGSIAGTVTRPDGTPVPNAAVFAVGTTEASSQRWGRGPTLSLPPVQATTDAEGAFRIDRLSEDFTYTVFAAKSEDVLAACPAEDTLVFPVVRFKATHDYAVCPGIRVRAGSCPVPVNLRLGEAVVVRGRVTERATGEPVAGVFVRALTGRGMCVGQGDTTDENGQYQIMLSIDKPETVQLLISYFQAGTMYSVDDLGEASHIRVTPGEMRTIDFAIDAPVPVPIRVVYRDGTPFEGAAIMTRDLVSDSWSFGIGCFTDSEGRYTLRGLKPEHTYKVVAGIRHRDGGWTPLATSEPFTTAYGETPPEVVLVIDPMGGLAGTIVAPEGYPLWDKLVRFEALNPHSGEACAGEARSNDEGRFAKILALPEGYYPEIRISLRRGGAPYYAIVGDVTIRRDEITDLGPIDVVPDPQAAEQTPS
jgi:RNA polymerase sigma factor (sigma-70 family)